MSELKINREKLDAITVSFNNENNAAAAEAPADKDIAALLTEHMQEPSVPEEFVDRWAVRAEAILAGREAEKALADPSVALDAAQTADLAAKSVVGRMMLNRMPPKGVTGEQMTEQLREMPSFRMQTAKPRSRLLYDIRTGEIVRSTVKSTPAPRAAGIGREAPEAASLKAAPEAPHIAPPDKTR